MEARAFSSSSSGLSLLLLLDIYMELKKYNSERFKVCYHFLLMACLQKLNIKKRKKQFTVSWEETSLDEGLRFMVSKGRLEESRTVAFGIRATENISRLSSAALESIATAPQYTDNATARNSSTSVLFGVLENTVTATL
jgi:hypothetical protein